MNVVVIECVRRVRRVRCNINPDILDTQWTDGQRWGKKLHEVSAEHMRKYASRRNEIQQAGQDKVLENMGNLNHASLASSDITSLP